MYCLSTVNLLWKNSVSDQSKEEDLCLFFSYYFVFLPSLLFGVFMYAYILKRFLEVNIRPLVPYHSTRQFVDALKNLDYYNFKI